MGRHWHNCRRWRRVAPLQGCPLRSMREHEDPEGDTTTELSVGPRGPVPVRVQEPVPETPVGVREEAVVEPVPVKEPAGVPQPVPAPPAPGPVGPGVGPFRTIEDFDVGLQEVTAALIEEQGEGIESTFRAGVQDLEFLHRDGGLVSVREQNRQRGEAVATQVGAQMAEEALVRTIVESRALWPYPLFALPLIYKLSAI